MSAKEYFWSQRASRSTTNPKEDYDYLHHRIEKITLINRALWEIIAQQHDLSKDQLLAKVAEIDLRDGELDQALHQPIIHCPNCGRKINARHHHCLYCGFDDLPEDVFTSV